MRIRHVINVVGGSARGDLLAEQRLALETIDIARRQVPDHIQVEVVGVRYSDEDQPADWLVDRDQLERSVLDLGSFRHPRRLPLLVDVLRPFAGDDYDLGVFTNIDIALQPRFYELLAELYDQGHDAFVINRRTVQLPRPGAVSAVWLTHQVGAPHPGHDCFVFTPSVFSGADLDDVCLGMPYVMRSLVYHMMLTADRFRDFTDLHATFHVGDDREWAGPEFDDYRDHNTAALRRSIARMIERHGIDRIASLPAIRPHLRSLGGESVPDRLWVQRYDRRLEPLTFDSRRLVFAASPGRSGSGYLARLLGTGRDVTAAHEPEPQMIGRHVRDVAFGSIPDSYQRRLAKAAALSSRLAELPPKGIYVETTHMFVKTFADVVLDEFNHDRISIVHLHRPLGEMVASMASLGWFTPLSRVWKDWLITPTAPGAVFRLDPDQIAGPTDLIIGYILDTELRTRLLRRGTPGVRWVDFDLEPSVEPRCVEALFEQLDIVATDDTWSQAGRQVNLRRRRKQELSIAPSAADAAELIRSFRTRFATEIQAASLDDMFVSTDQKAAR